MPVAEAPAAHRAPQPQPASPTTLPLQRQAVLQRRLHTQMPLLRERLARLYGHTTDFEVWLNQLIQRCLDSATDRPEALWQQDLAREAQPDWHQHAMLGYCTYVDKFAGTLRGVARRIPHLQELGVTYLHLLPFLKAGTPPNDGGFAVASYEAIEPALGTLQDLRELTAQLRAVGISLCSDFVLNHVSHDHPWAQQALAGDPQYRGYFHWAVDTEQVRAWEQHLGQIFPSTAPGNFTYIPAQQAWVWTTFYPYQWDLNYSNPQVFADMAQALLQLANQGVESFRLDSTAFLWKRLGTNCMNQPETHWLLQALRALVNIAAPGVLLKAEAIMPTRDLPPYFGLGEARGRECHVAYHSSLMSASWVALAEQNAQLLGDVLRNTPALPPGCSWMTYVRCHDDIGWNVLRPELDARGSDQRQRLIHASRFFAGQTPDSYARGASFQADDPSSVHGTNGMSADLVGLSSARTPQEQALAVQRLVLMQALSLFVGSLPLIYMGDEFALPNTSADELAARQGPDGRELHRPPFDEARFALRHDPGTVPGQVFAALCALTQARRLHPVLHASGPIQVFETGQPAVLGLRRAGQCLGLFNFSGQAQAIDLGAFRRSANALLLADLVHPGQFYPDTLHLPPYSICWLQAQD